MKIKYALLIAYEVLFTLQNIFPYHKIDYYSTLRQYYNVWYETFNENQISNTRLLDNMLVSVTVCLY